MRARVIPKTTMRKFDELCLTPVEPLAPEEIQGRATLLRGAADSEDDLKVLADTSLAPSVVARDQKLRSDSQYHHAGGQR